MNNKNSKKHHFLPRSILKQFANQDNRVYVYDKKRRKMFLSSIKNAGAENHYNTINIGGKVYNLEENFNDFDGELASVINRTITNGSILNEQHDFLLYAILVQLQRSPIQRSSYINISSSIKEMTKNITDQEDLSCYDINDNQAKILSLQSIAETEDSLFDAIENRKIILLKDNENKLITSDNAVVMHSISNYAHPALTSPYTEVDFPISSEYALSLVPDKVIECIDNNSKESKDMSCLKRSILTGCCFSISENYRSLLNSLQILRSKRFIYSNYDCSDFIDEILGKNQKAADRESLLTIGTQKNRNISKKKHIVIWIGTDYEVYELVDYKTRELTDLNFTIPSKYKNIGRTFKTLTSFNLYAQSAA